MAITYTWKITGVKKAPSLDGLSNVITHVNFDYTGSKGSGANKKESTFHGACPVGAPDSESFIDIDKVTEANVIEWAQANHPVDHMNEVIGKKIAELETPTNVEVNSSELSWLPTAETPEGEQPSGE